MLLGPSRNGGNVMLLNRYSPGLLVTMLVLAVGVLASLIGFIVGPDPQVRAQERAPVALVYRGPASCPGCPEAVASLIRRSPRGFSVRFVGPTETLKLTAENLRGVALYAQPGGNGTVGQAHKALGASSARAIADYVAGGGHYVGFCMGAYLAGSDPGMGLLAPGNTGQYVGTRGASLTSTRDAVIPVRWEGSARRHFAQDPPYILPSGLAGERVLSRFTNNRVNALVKPYHKGGVGVVGTHPEADRSWYGPKLWKQDKDGLDAAQGLRLIEETMRF